MTAATAKDVARLFGRAAFGATKDILATWTGQPYDDVVASLFPPTADRTPETDEPRRVQLEGATSDVVAAQRWWLDRMRTATYPLEERMTWFWHTHFATAYAGNPNVGDLMKQNQLLRRNALGSFRTLAEEITVDVAMLYWLSGNTNTKGRVNENYARELFELFTSGMLPPQHDETLVRTAAKALTGWGVNGERKAYFDGTKHDRTPKDFGDRTIGGYPAGDPREAVEYKEVVDFALDRPTTAKFVAYKLVSSFAYTPATTNLLTDPDPLVDAVAAAFGPSWDIRNAVWTLLTHDGFRNAPPKSLVRSPVELTVHLAKCMNVDCEPPRALYETKAAAANYPVSALRRMGQVPFQPPNVGGWPEARRALSATTTHGRYALGHYLTLAATNQNTYALTPLPASGDLAAWTAFVGLGHLEALTTQRLQAFLANPGTTDEAVKKTGVLLVLTSSPQWQVM